MAIAPLRAQNPPATPVPSATTPGATPSGQAVQPSEARIVISPAPSALPRINGPKIYGARPGHPFLYRIPCTGERPMKFAVDGLPSGLSLNTDTGIVTGTVPARVPLLTRRHDAFAQITAVGLHSIPIPRNATD